MNSLDDLRRTLDAHAHATTGQAFDTVGLHGRIADTRRRRTAIRGGVALAAVAAVAAAAVVPQLAGRDDAGPATRTVLGDEVPATYEALGLTYALSDVTASEKSRTVRVTPTSTDDGTAPLLSWTTEDPGAEVTVVDPETDEVLWYSRDGEFTDHITLGSVAPVEVRSSSPGVAAALYAWDAEVPVEGYTEDGFVFPQRSEGVLLGADVAPAGQTELTVTVSSDSDRVGVRSVCTGADGFAVEVSVLGGLTTVGECDSTRGVISGSDASGSSDTDPGGTGTEVRVRLVRSERDHTPVPAGEAPGVVIGVAVREPVEVVRSAGAGGSRPVTRFIEARGHEWQLVADPTTQGRRVSADKEAGTTWIVQALWTGTPAPGTPSDGESHHPQVEADGKRISVPGAGLRFVNEFESPRTTEYESGLSVTPPGSRTVSATASADLDDPTLDLLAWSLYD